MAASDYTTEDAFVNHVTMPPKPHQNSQRTTPKPQTCPNKSSPPPPAPQSPSPHPHPPPPLALPPPP
ncbi:hypothetical protein AUEXF2481DRAFT_5056 [Aureobasidium subglaciale EXF-2481]|uniref:Uncharacterized protein n=1 Tax=Aureobasidium subglaciale (strain EXF-2481) TaxID=1043005 RepID=A0A074Z9F5_AURSE|nr:uncharacterized protein AUEXF2481DRAFT_5056 [Aureobasidium subglaciale EXF-2481]KEQ95451.1 hypothetical protein AUEXF2481DRAFT_5056 [Aureobasidium subglaciale EXF-2481]